MIALTACVISPSQQLVAGIISINAVVDGMVIDESGNGTDISVVNLADTSLLSGRFDDATDSPSGSNSAIVFAFQLPDYGAVADPFLNATFTFELQAPTTGGYSHNLDGLQSRNSSTIVEQDYRFGSVSGSTSSTLLQSAVLLPAGSSAAGSLTSVDISSYLNTQYDNGTNAGDFFFLRISGNGNPSVFNNTTNGARITSSDNGANAPFVTFESDFAAVPEPSTVWFFSFLAVGSIFYRRRISTTDASAK